MTMKRIGVGRVLSISVAASMAAGGVDTASAAPPDALVAAAKQEGQLTTIALPHDWCGYGALIAAFQKKYGIHVNELNPDAGSGDEIEAIKANRETRGRKRPT
jgi:putative spermidine/putrescine transport system substrate-binding protein